MASELLREVGPVDDETRAVVHRLFERVYSRGELSLVEDLVATDFVGDSTESSELYLGQEGVKSHVIRLRTAFQGFTVEIEDLLVEGDRFSVTCTARGTHERRFLDIEPTCNIGAAGEEPHGNRIAVACVATGTIRNGKIHGSSMAWDVDALRDQLGATVDHSETDLGVGRPMSKRPSLLERGAR